MSPPRSKAWNCFKKKNSSIAVCKICTKEVKYCGNTSNLFKHLKNHSNAPMGASATDSVNVEIDSSQQSLTDFVTNIEQSEPSTSNSLKTR